MMMLVIMIIWLMVMKKLVKIWMISNDHNKDDADENEVDGESDSGYGSSDRDSHVDVAANY